MKIRVARIDESCPPVIGSVQCVHQDSRCVILHVDLLEKWCEPGGYSNNSVLFGSDLLMVDGLGDSVVFAESSKHTAFVALVDRDLVDKMTLEWSRDRDEYSELEGEDAADLQD